MACWEACARGPAARPLPLLPGNHFLSADAPEIQVSGLWQGRCACQDGGAPAAWHEALHRASTAVQPRMHFVACLATVCLPLRQSARLPSRGSGKR